MSRWTTPAFGYRCVVASVTRTCTGEPVRTWPSDGILRRRDEDEFACGTTPGAIVTVYDLPERSASGSSCRRL